MTRVFWDTMLFVYLFEEHVAYAPRVAQIRKQMLLRGDQLYTSSLCVGEILAGCYKKGNAALADKYRSFFRGRTVTVAPFTVDAAELFAQFRAAMNLAAADAVHLACAAEAQTDIFITNDATLVGKTVPDVKFIVGLNTDLF